MKLTRRLQNIFQMAYKNDNYLLLWSNKTKMVLFNKCRLRKGGEQNNNNL